MQAEVLAIEAHQRIKSGAWCIRLRYRYLIDGKSFNSNRFSLASKLGCYRDKRVADALLEQFQPGSRIQVRVDPSAPEQSIIRLEEMNVSDWVWRALAIVLLPAGLLLLRGRQR